jgi:serine/threonine protein phosphatase PrpC
VNASEAESAVPGKRGKRLTVNERRSSEGSQDAEDSPGAKSSSTVQKARAGKRSSEDRDVPEATPEAASTATVFPTPQELLKQVANPTQIYDIATHDFCAFGGVTANQRGQTLIEPEYTEKKLEIDPPQDAENFRRMLEKLGIGFCCKKGKKPEQPNQDNVFICKMDTFLLCGVADGHGPDGHWVSHWAVRFVLRLLMAEMGKTGAVPPNSVMTRIFDLTHQGVCAQSDACGFDTKMSGSTLTLSIVDLSAKRVVAAWVGDSRCALGDADGTKGVSLTNDHKPNDKDEKARIRANGGEVVRLDGDVPHRVFVKNGEVPGLAMSRAVGDCIAHRIGVIHEPDIVHNDAPQHVLLCCSDGVWEFIESNEAVEIIGKKGREKVWDATELLTRESRNRWLKEEEIVTDDISAICIYV